MKCAAMRTRNSWRQGDSRGQIEDLDKAIELSPEDPNHYLLRGYAYEESASQDLYADRDLLAKAERDFVKALELSDRAWESRADAEKTLAFVRKMKERAEREASPPKS